MVSRKADGRVQWLDESGYYKIFITINYRENTFSFIIVLLNGK